MSENLHGYYLEDLSVGMSASYAKTVTEADVILFAGISGDDNPVHVNEEFAATTMFKGRIVHGMFSAGLISTVLGTRLPGPGCIYVSQQLKFKAPVRIGETVTATVTIKEVNAEKRRVILETVCTVKGKMVLDGESMMMVDSRA
ncbi:MAG: MaoC family dehydratase [Candidatus Competibacteraceae bacterium]|jgi:3-hydroxybutyryl-CoA dehydratase|nr:MaoC family dehydratase [Candidatus Competibacteraceae bacterium]